MVIVIFFHQVMEDEVTYSVGKLLRQHRVHLDEVAYSTALFIIASPDGESLSSRVAKWFHPDEGERYFTYPLNSTSEEYFAVVLFEGDKAAQLLSFGVVRDKQACLDIFSFQAQHPSVLTAASPAGYVVEIACIANDKACSLTDFSEAKHIEGKYLQRSKNLANYYPPRPPALREDPPTFMTIVQQGQQQEESQELIQGQHQV